MNPPDTATPTPDLVDRLAGLEPGSATHLTRHRRDKVAAATQGSYDALFDPDLPGLSLTERLLVAVYACRLTPADALTTHYRERLAGLAVSAEVLAVAQSGEPEQLPQGRLRAMLCFTRTLITAPIEGDEAALKALPAAGLSTAAIVALGQLIAFLSYQTRLVSGLRALAAMRAGQSVKGLR